MIILSVNNLNKSFGVESILQDINFSINEGEKIGVIGLNGSGKTTLFKILSGMESYDSGNIFTAKNTKIGYLEQNTNFHSDKTIYDEVLMVYSELIEREAELREMEQKIAKAGENSEDKDTLDELMHTYSNKMEEFEKLDGYGYKSEVRGVLIGLGFNEEEFDKPVAVLSGGEKSRVLLAKILIEKSNILLLDEPTNHLDANAIEWLETFISQYKGTVITISHDRYFLDQTVDKIYEISHRKLTEYNGNYTYYLAQSKINREILEKKYENQQEEIKRQEEAARRLRSFGSEKKVKRARSIEKRIDKIDRIDRPESISRGAVFNFRKHLESGKNVMQARGLSKGYDTSLFHDVDIDIYRGDKVALIGPNGAGKSTLFKILSGEVDADSGDVKFGTNVMMSYFHQEQKTLNLDNSVIDEIWEEAPGLTQTEIRNMLASFLFYDEDVFKILSSLSGGERARVAILKLILSNSNFLLLDEPTNHLDIDSKNILEEALLDYDGTIFTISHDRYFLNKVVDRILVLEDGKITEYLGNYDYYIEKKKQKEMMYDVVEEEEKTKTQIKEERKREREISQKLKEDRKKLQNIESDIEETEKHINALEFLLCQEEIFSDPQKTMEVSIEKAELEEKLEKLMEKWENLAE